MIGLRSIVRFINKNRCTDMYIVREIRYNNKLLLESTKSDGIYYIIDLDDVEEVDIGVENDKA